MAIKAIDVFVPAGFPRHTYVSRDGSKYERTLKETIESKGMIASIAGPSKTGKTMLVERVVGRESLVEVSGARIRKAEDLWELVLDELALPNRSITGSETTRVTDAEVGLSGSLFRAAPVRLGRSTARVTSTSMEHQRHGLSSVLRVWHVKPFVLLIDDFHFVERPVQLQIAREIKEAAHKGVSVCIAVVPHRADDVVRSLPELQARVRSIDLPTWNQHDLEEIARLGFERLNVEGNILMPHEFARESAGSPALMQAICLYACNDRDLTKVESKPRRIELGDSDFQRILRTASSHVNKKSHAQALLEGPRLRGKKRQVFELNDGTSGDVYYCVLKAIVSDPIRRTFGYNILQNRVSGLVQAPFRPAGSAVVGACEQMAKIARDRFPEERLLEWDTATQCLDVIEPSLWFYLRWSDFLRDHSV